MCHLLLVINSTYHRLRDMATYSFKYSIPKKFAATPLQMDTWLLLTAYRKMPPPYPMVSSQTLL